MISWLQLKKMKKLRILLILVLIIDFHDPIIAIGQNSSYENDLLSLAKIYKNNHVVEPKVEVFQKLDSIESTDLSGAKLFIKELIQENNEITSTKYLVKPDSITIWNKVDYDHESKIITYKKERTYSNGQGMCFLKNQQIRIREALIYCRFDKVNYKYYDGTYRFYGRKVLNYEFEEKGDLIEYFFLVIEKSDSKMKLKKLTVEEVKNYY